MARTLLLLAVALSLVAAAPAQQMEPNSAGGSILVNGNIPTPGAPFALGPGAPLTFTVGGTPNAPYALFVGQLAPVSIFLGPVAGQYFDLDPTSVAVLGNGISGGGALPPFLFLLDGAGQSTWSFPISPGAVGLTLAVQAAVQDATLPPFNLNLTAAAEFSIVNRLTLTGQQVGNYPLPSGPYPYYGTMWSSIDVSTSGWIRFGSTATNPDPFPIRTNFLLGTVGDSTPAPLLVPMWGTFQFSGAGSEVVIEETSPGVTQIDWKNGFDFLNGQAVGSFSCTIDVTLGSPIITLDYTNFTNTVPPSVPLFTGNICGVTDAFSTAQTEHDLVVTGAVNPYTALGPETLFQEFGIGSPIGENVDLGGTILTLVDVVGGTWSLF